MRITVQIHVAPGGAELGEDAPVYKAGESYANAPHVQLEDGPPCPHCNAAPLRVAGFKGRSSTVTTAEATYTACGCVACGKHVGTLKVHAASLFGEDEDRAVLQGLHKVY